MMGKVFSVAYFLCFAVSVFAFAAYEGPYQIARPLQNFALVYCLLALGIEHSTLVFAAIFMLDYKKAIYAAVVFRRHRPPS